MARGGGGAQAWSIGPSHCSACFRAPLCPGPGRAGGALGGASPGAGLGGSVAPCAAGLHGTGDRHGCSPFDQSGWSLAGGRLGRAGSGAGLPLSGAEARGAGELPLCWPLAASPQSVRPDPGLEAGWGALPGAQRS